MSSHVLLAFFVYFLALLAIGVSSYRRSKTATDFMVGGRSLNFYVTALSAQASDMSSWLFMAYPGLIFAFGGGSIWVAVGLFTGMWAVWTFVAPRLRRETERTGSLTLNAYFAARFGDDRGWMRSVSAALSILYFTFYVAAGLVGIGYLFESVLGFDRVLGMSIGIFVVMIYTTIGGFHSIAWVDTWQALFLLAMVVLVPILALVDLGGWDELQLHGRSWMPTATVRNVVYGVLGWGLGYFGQTHVLSKFMGIKHPKELRKAKYVGLSWQLICLIAATFVGFLGIAYFQGHLDNDELVFVLMVKQLFHPFLGGIVLSAVIAATISTMDSQILVLVSTLSQDVYHRFFHKRATGKEMVWVSRVCVVLVCLLAYIAALFSHQNVLTLVFYSWSGLGSAFGPVLLLALHTKRINFAGAMTGMVFGGVIAAVWPLIEPTIPVPAMVPGFCLNLVVIYLVSWATSRRKAAS